MRFSTISVLATSIALTSALPTNKTPNKPDSGTPNSNIEYCESQGINALNCVKLLNDLNLDLDILNDPDLDILNDLNLDLDILGKREALPEPNGKNAPAGSPSTLPPQANVEYCTSQGFLNVANCLDILSDVEIDVSLLSGADLRERDWSDHGSPTKPDESVRPSPTPSPRPFSPTKPEEPEEPEDPNSGSSNADVTDCQSSGLINALNCLDILNDVDIDIGILHKE